MSQRDTAFTVAMLLACGVAYAIAADVEQAAKGVAERTNAFRKAQGLEPVQPNAELRAAAREFARFMAESGKYSHTADGRRPAQRAAAQGYEACIVSENIAYLYRSQGYDAPTLAREMVEGWKQSPEHREAMVDPAVSQVGVGIAQSASGRYYGVQMFGRPKSAAITFTVRNRSGERVAYRAGERRFSLPPRAERTHSVCRPMQLAMETPAPFSGRARDGATYLVRGGGRVDVVP
ncbi:MAG TPA: CAP domain-containing protein [Burkholderiales bacterium]